MQSTFWMDRALALARRGTPLSAPNPAVGAVLVKDGQLIGEGYHHGPGQPHAEAEALDEAHRRGFDPRGATLYVTLEPCCHTGEGKRTPPCAQRLVAEGISQVYAGLQDPNPQVAGRGAALLERSGVNVVWGPRAQEARNLVADFAAWIGPRRPFVTLKWAQSLNGSLTGQPGVRWITGPQARAEAHRLRSLHDAVAVGAGTLRVDDPQLTVRGRAGATAQPRRLVFAGRSPLPASARLFTDEHRGATWVVADPAGPTWRQAASLVGQRRVAWDGVNAAVLGQRLLDAGFHRVLVEGGPRLLTTFLTAGIWDRAAVFTAPALLPGRGLEGALPPLTLAEARWTSAGVDGLLEGWNPLAPALAAERTRQEAVCSPV